MDFMFLTLTRAVDDAVKPTYPTFREWLSSGPPAAGGEEKP